MWQIKKLEEICNFQNGFAFKSKFFKSSGLPVLRISNIQNENLETEDLVFFDPKDYKENFVKFRVEKGDLVIAMSGATTGKLGINNSDTVFYLNQRVGKFLPKENLAKKYLHYFLSTRVEENLRISAGSAQPNLSTEQIKNLEIPLPPIDEQKRIVGILDEVFEGVAKAKENVEGNLRNVSEVFEAYLQSVFANRGKGWEENSLGNVCEIYQPRTISTKEMKHDGPYVVYGANGVIGKYDKYNHEEPQLLITCRGATCGSVNISTPKAWINGNAMVVRPKDASLEREFLTYFFRNGSEISKTITGAAQPQITRTTLAPLKIGFPKSLSEQKSIVTKLDALSTETKKLEAIYKTKLDHLEELKKSILKKAFNGEL